MILAFAVALALPQPELPACVGQLQADITVCDTAIAAEKDAAVRARLLHRRAYSQNERHEYEAALRDLNAAVVDDPSYGPAWHELSYTYGELREFARAVAASERDVALGPTNVDAYRERAFARHGLGDLKGAWEDQAKVAALQPGKPAPVLARGRAALWLGRFEEARADTAAGKALAQAVGDAEALGEAEGQERRIALWTTRSGAASAEAACLAAEKQGRFEAEAVIGDCTAAFLTARTLKLKAEMLTTRSLALLAVAHDEDAATEDRAMAVALDPDNADWHQNLGSAYVMARHSWAGRREFDIAIRLKDNWPARAGRAAARYNLKDYAGAFEDAKKSFEMRPNELALTVLGDLAHDRGDDKSAKLYWMGAWHLGDHADAMLDRLKGIGVADPEKEPKS
jgi:tetratricopeptide (TPR) repeat protein